MRYPQMDVNMARPAALTSERQLHKLWSQAKRYRLRLHLQQELCRSATAWAL